VRLQLFRPGFIPGIRNKTMRRVIMIAVSPAVFVEYLVNAPLGFIADYRACWNFDTPDDTH
jgi:hypothetical protein